jgi:hypothetical protein
MYLVTTSRTRTHPLRRMRSDKSIWKRKRVLVLRAGAGVGVGADAGAGAGAAGILAL